MRLFDRYADQTLRLDAPGRDLCDSEGRRFGSIDRLSVVRNRLVLEGWTDADRIGIALNLAQTWTVPELAQPGKSPRGFTLDLPFEPGPFRILAEMPGVAAPRVAIVPGFAKGQVARARALRWIPYLRAVAGLVPQIWRWKRHGDPAAREVIKKRLHLVPASDAVVMDSAAVLGATAPVEAFTAVTIVMPVFNAFDLLRESVGHVLRHTKGAGIDTWRLILIEDKSSDPLVRPWLEALATGRSSGPGQVLLILSDTNLGFVGSVNRGLAAARAWPDDPVILLNTDAMVPPNWAARLVAPLADPGVASATPMSNDAEIFSVPAICRAAPLPEGAAERLDAAARLLSAGQPVTVPTGVGFCMAMAPDYLGRLPTLDPAFGRGYGEETDWCQRARALGGRHVAVANLFVEHRSGASFGQTDKTCLLATNGALISRRYPRYDGEVQDFVRADPLVAPRLALALSWASEMAAGRPVPVWLAHAMGGGAEVDLQRRLADSISAQGAAVVLRVGQGLRWRLEVHTAHGIVQGLTGDEHLMRALLARLPTRHIIYSCGVGDPDAVALPGLLLDLAGRPRADGRPLPGGAQLLEVLVHDFFPISPSYTLLGADGRYRGVPRPGTPFEMDPAHRAEGAGGRRVQLAEWQVAWGALLVSADRITVFSRSSRAIMAEAYPDAANKLVVTPHALPLTIGQILPARQQDGRPAIGVLGNIGAHKGAAVLQHLVRDLARTKSAGLVVIGLVDPAFPLAAPACIHGSYEHRDLPSLVARYGISAWLIPSIWPETFSFTTHEALATGMPVFAFDIGAQGEAVRAAVAGGAPGGVLPLDAGGAIAAEALLARLQPRGNPGARGGTEVKGSVA